MCFKTALSILYHQYESQPTTYHASKQIVFGLLLLFFLFVIHQQWISKLQLRFYRKKLLRSQILEISVLVNSSLFAIFVCIVSAAGKYNDIN